MSRLGGGAHQLVQFRSLVHSLQFRHAVTRWNATLTDLGHEVRGEDEAFPCWPTQFDVGPTSSHASGFPLQQRHPTGPCYWNQGFVPYENGHCQAHTMESEVESAGNYSAL